MSITIRESAQVVELLTPDVIARICELSFKEGRGHLSHHEQNELELISSVDHHLSNKASSRLNDLMISAYKLGELVTRGEA